MSEPEHIHILGICGTFMGGIAAIARQAGYRVTGCDANVYPPMSTQLEAQGIVLIEGFGAEQIELKPDMFIIGNVVSRGNPLMEEILNCNLPYVSGPQWLAETILRDKWVLAVAGTHGKTTTAAMLAWILEYAGLNPGFLIGGVPQNFGVSARLNPTSHPTSTSSEHTLLKGVESGEADTPLPTFAKACPEPVEVERLEGTSLFVIEADEYDTAFFDKRSKFVHYHPRIAILNNLEFDHADIFADLASIETQFHHLVRTVPGNGLVVCNGKEESLWRVLQRGCWTPVTTFGLPHPNPASRPTAGYAQPADSCGWKHAFINPAFVPEGEGVIATDWSIDANDCVTLNGEVQGKLEWDLLGNHNRMNALAALAAARHAGVAVAQGLAALAEFKNVKRRMEVRGTVNGITVYDDFAHHPTAIDTTLNGLRRKAGKARILAVLEPRSNTMKLGVMKDALPGSLRDADLVFCYAGNLGWDVRGALSPLGENAVVKDDLDDLVAAIVAAARAGDHVLVMSNGGFGGIHDKLLEKLVQGRD